MEKTLFSTLVILCLILPNALAQVGIGTTDPKAFLNVPRGQTVLFGEDSSGTGSKLIWYGSKGAFRVGNASNSVWDNANAGHYSFATGISSVASNTAAVSMGNSTTASGYAAISLGDQTTASGNAAISLGYSTTASSIAAISTGANTQAIGSAAVSTGAYTRAIGVAAVSMGYSTTANGNQAVSMGLSTSASGDRAVSMGYLTAATGKQTVSMGYQTIASGDAAVSMGNATTASGNQAVSMGTSTSASGNQAVSMGDQSRSSGYAAVSMGTSTTASNEQAVTMGKRTLASGLVSLATGYQTTASGEVSTAMGANVSTNGQRGSFIIGDRSDNVYNNSADNQMMMRFGGGYVLYTTNGAYSGATAVGVQVAAGGNAWTTISDSTRKENFRTANGTDFLQKIARMRLGSWNYKGQDVKQYRHYGPMAQDFYAAFGRDGLGTIGEDKSINQADFDGVNLIAIQALIQENQHLKARLAAFEEKEKATQGRLDKIEALLQQQPINQSVSLKP